MTKFNALAFLEAYKVPFEQAGANTSRRWVGVQCPFCDDPSTHGGFSLENGGFNCWRCGPKRTLAVIAKFARCSDAEARKVFARFAVDNAAKLYTPKVPKAAPRPERGRLSWPVGTTDLGPRHRAYLASRNYDADTIAAVWGVKGTGPIGPYKHRILIPVHNQRGKLVTYTSRDITGKAAIRYKACRPEDEVEPIKSTVYGLHKVRGGRCLLVEGPFDVWRIGPGAVCGFGVELSARQLTTLSRAVGEVSLLFDPGATQQAEKWAAVLSMAGLAVDVLPPYDTDPGDLAPEVAAQLRKDLKL